MGHGRLNAFEAVKATNPYTMQGQNQFCTSENYSIPNLPTGATVTWSVSGGLTINGSNTANLVNIVKSISGTGVLSAAIAAIAHHIQFLKQFKLLM